MNIEKPKPDRRVSRTRRQLRDALMALILERGYNAVKIEDITERADLGRTTFYLHYRDKEELLIESLETIAEELKSQVEILSDLRIEQGRSQVNPVGVVFCHVDENRDLYRIILKGEGSSTVFTRIRDMIEAAAVEFFMRRISGLASSPPALPSGLVAGYFASAMLGFIAIWLEKELPLTGDEAADDFMMLFFRGAASVLNMPVEI